MRSSREYAVRELDRRQGDGLDVALLWETPTDRLLVVVADLRAGTRFRMRVSPEDALDAFQHPYAYYRGDRREAVPTTGA